MSTPSTPNPTYAHVESATSEHEESIDLPAKTLTQGGRELLLAKHAGFCHGVKKSVNKTFEARSNSPQTVYVLGELIHNPQMISRLAQNDIQTVKNLEEVPDGGTCIIRTHGTTPALFAQAAARNIEVHDATCPDVTLVQQKAMELARDGYTVVIVGKAQHPEVVGIMAHALDAAPGAHVVAIHRVEEIDEKLAGLPRRRLGVVSQTTQMEEAFFDMVRALSMRTKELKVFNTICPATFFRQRAALDLSQEVEVMVVVGGKNSSNTTHLAEVAREKGIPALHVETAQELSQREELPALLKAVHKVGITAGASTPDWLVKEVLDYLAIHF